MRIGNGIAVQWIDLGLGCLPIVNSVKSLALMAFRGFGEPFFQESNSWKDDVRICALLKTTSDMVWEAIPLVGNLYSLGCLVHSVVSHYFGIDSLGDSLTRRGKIEEVDYLYVARHPDMRDSVFHRFVERALLQEDQSFLHHLHDKMGERISVGLLLFYLCRARVSREQNQEFLSKVLREFSPLLNKEEQTIRKAIRGFGLGVLDVGLFEGLKQSWNSQEVGPTPMNRQEDAYYKEVNHVVDIYMGGHRFIGRESFDYLVRVAIGHLNSDWLHRMKERLGSVNKRELELHTIAVGKEGEDWKAFSNSVRDLFSEEDHKRIFGETRVSSRSKERKPVIKKVAFFEHFPIGQETKTG